MALLESSKTQPGWQAPDFNLKGTDDKMHTLSEYAGKKGLLIVFTCNHCPYAKASWKPLNELYKKFGDDIHFVAINPNDADNYPEDSFDAMKQNQDATFPYLYDESQEVAKQYDAQCTPDIYLFKNENDVLKLFYRGRINDKWQNPELVKEKNLEMALQDLVDGKQAPEVQPPSMGCSIKWK